MPTCTMFPALNISPYCIKNSKLRFYCKYLQLSLHLIPCYMNSEVEARSVNIPTNNQPTDLESRHPLSAVSRSSFFCNVSILIRSSCGPAMAFSGRIPRQWSQASWRQSSSKDSKCLCKASRCANLCSHSSNPTWRERRSITSSSRTSLLCTASLKNRQKACLCYIQFAVPFKVYTAVMKLVQFLPSSFFWLWSSTINSNFTTFSYNLWHRATPLLWDNSLAAHVQLTIRGIPHHIYCTSFIMLMPPIGKQAAYTKVTPTFNVLRWGFPFINAQLRSSTVTAHDDISST